MTKVSALVFLALSLIPSLAEAQRPGSGGAGTAVSSSGHQAGGGAMSVGRSQGYGYGHGHGHGYGYGGFTPRGGLAPFTGFGHINHPGLGYAPNTPGMGYPLTPGIQPLPTISQPLIGPIRPGATGFGRPGTYGRPYPYGHSYPGGYHYKYGYGAGLGGVTIVGVPVAVPVVVGGYGYDYGYGYPQAPQVIIIQQPAEQGQLQAQEQQWLGPTRTEREGEQEPALIYETRPPAAPEKPVGPLTLLVFKDHSIYAVTEYWKEGDQLCYVTSYGSKNCVSLDLLDVEFSKKLNAERNVKFEL